MRNTTDHGYLAIVTSFLLALALTILPLPSAAEPYRPQWIALVVLYWCVYAPSSVSVGTAWVLGLMLDTLQGALLGQHALALATIAYIAGKFHLRLRVFPIGQQTLTIVLIAALYQFLLLWVDGIMGEVSIGLHRLTPVAVGLVAWPLIALAIPRLRTAEQLG